ncbi:MAG: hypothetical protein RLY97_178 [Pseudomonadota bacterium]|jgi:hypothetical protein
MSISGTIIACVAIAAWASVRHARIQKGELHRGQLGGIDIHNLRDRFKGRDWRDKLNNIMPDLAPSPRENELQHEVEELRKRIAVLERITTEANSTEARRSRDIAAEIESLRDQ